LSSNLLKIIYRLMTSREIFRGIVSDPQEIREEDGEGRRKGIKCEEGRGG
jgi:hypothetical protein